MDRILRLWKCGTVMRSQLMHSVEVLGDKIEIRQLLPVHFIEHGICPISFFTIERPKTMAEQVMRIQEEQEPKSQLEAMKKVLGAGVISLNKKPFNVDAYLEQETRMEHCLMLMAHVIELSFSYRTMTKITLQMVQAIDKMAKRYGQKPIEYLLGPVYTPMDAYAFDLLVYSLCHNEEISLVNRLKLPASYAI